MTSKPWLRVVLFEPCPGRWRARALEHDIEVEERSSEAALDALLRIVFAHVGFDRRHGRPPLSAFSSAPAPFWQAFEAATLVRTVPTSEGSSGENRGSISVAIWSRPAPWSDQRQRQATLH